MKRLSVAKSESTSKRLVTMRSGDERSSLGEMDLVAQKALKLAHSAIVTSVLLA